MKPDTEHPHQPAPALQPEQETLALPSAGQLKVKNRRKKPPILLLAGIIFLIGIILTVLAGNIWYTTQLKPLSSEDAPYKIVTIQTGASSAKIAQLLQDQHIIRNATAFRWYVRLNDNPSLQAGDYRLSAHQSVKEVVAMLSAGRVSTLDVLIPPGQRLDQIKGRLMHAGYSEAEITEALEAVRSHQFLRSVPKTALLEGYLFPDTYRIGPRTSAQELLVMMLDNFEKQITKEIKDGLAQQSIPLSDAIKLASIVQMEVPDYETQRMVAQVFIKRLKSGMPLGADPTFRYAAAMTGQEPSPALDSPYNTRIYAGLPPTPIANFNISALRAVARPSGTNYNYFVSGDDGKTHFSHTLEEHQQATRKYCTTLCQ